MHKKKFENRKTLFLAIIIIVVCLLINVIFCVLHTLKEPVFLEHYYEYLAYDGMSFNINYVTNYWDDSKVMNVTFPSLKDKKIYVFSQADQYSHSYNNYKMNKVHINLRMPNNKITPTVIEDAIIDFDNGKSITVNIGKIILYNNNDEKDEKDEKDLIHSVNSMSSNQNISSTTLEAVDSIQLTDIDYSMKDKMVDIVVNKINGEDNYSYPVNIEKHEQITIQSSFNIPKNDVRKYNMYEINRKAYVKNLKEEIEFYPLLELIYMPEFNSFDVYKFLEYKEAI